LGLAAGSFASTPTVEPALFVGSPPGQLLIFNRLERSIL
jgi:hypothetical protein